MPLAVVANVDTSTPNLYFVQADHLDRPIKMTDGTETIVWDAVYKPFGDVYSISGTAGSNLRFPGQYFLIEDGLHYNWYRHYDPTLGRYLQPDPLGFVDGPSVYSYVHDSPIGLADPDGLEPRRKKTADPGPRCSGPNSVCEGGNQGGFLDLFNPGCLLCSDCFTKAFGRRPTGDDTE
jgi:RHS repeat-associated protein